MKIAALLLLLVFLSGVQTQAQPVEFACLSSFSCLGVASIFQSGFDLFAQQFIDVVSHFSTIHLLAINGTNAIPKFSGNLLILLLLKSLFAGIVAAFTPFVYAILPFTVGYLGRGNLSPAAKKRNAIVYAFAIVLIFTCSGILLSALIWATGISNYTNHWMFNVFFFRIFLTLGISFLGAFALRLPASWVNATATKAQAGSIKGIFYMALTLPNASFSSTFPIVGLVLVMAGDAGTLGPVAGLFGFSVGLGLPFVFPAIHNYFIPHKALLNQIKVILGFVSLFICLKFFANADEALGLQLLDREMFVVICVVLSVLFVAYMLGAYKLPNDYKMQENHFGIAYITLFRLFSAILAFVFVIYLLPGMWGATLPAVNGFLPKY